MREKPLEKDAKKDAKRDEQKGAKSEVKSSEAKPKKPRKKIKGAHVRKAHKRSKRYLDLLAKVEKDKRYAPKEAIELAKNFSNVKFDAAIDVHIRVKFDDIKAQTAIRGVVALPHGLGKSKRIAAFVPPEKEKEAKDAGADIVGGQNLIDEIQKTKKCDFDIAVATPDMMRNLGKVARILGQKGLMPNPRTETITQNPGKTIKELKGGKISFRSDETGNIHQSIGKVSFETQKLLENYKIFLDSVSKAHPDHAALNMSVTIASSMGPGVKVLA